MATYFYEKCLEVAQLTRDRRGEISANHSLGCVHFHMKEYMAAKAFHERHEEVAASIDLLEEVARANTELQKVVELSFSYACIEE
jgi:hypothetical protein